MTHHSFVPLLLPLVVSVDGRFVSSSVSVVIRHGAVFAPVDPFVRAFADRVDLNMSHQTISITRGDRRILLPILAGAPYVRGEAIVIPLAVVARALGETVIYQGRERIVEIFSPTPAMLATLAPAMPGTPLPLPRPTFTPTPIPTPQPTVTGIPQPRRTPLLSHSP